MEKSISGIHLNTSGKKRAMHGFDATSEHLGDLPLGSVPITSAVALFFLVQEPHGDGDDWC